MVGMGGRRTGTAVQFSHTEECRSEKTSQVLENKIIDDFIGRLNDPHVNDATMKKFVVWWCVGKLNLETTRRLRVEHVQMKHTIL